MKLGPVAGKIRTDRRRGPNLFVEVPSLRPVLRAGARDVRGAAVRWRRLRASSVPGTVSFGGCGTPLRAGSGCNEDRRLDATVGGDKPISVQSDVTWCFQAGDRPSILARTAD